MRPASVTEKADAWGDTHTTQITCPPTHTSSCTPPDNFACDAALLVLGRVGHVVKRGGGARRCVQQLTPTPLQMHLAVIINRNARQRLRSGREVIHPRRSSLGFGLADPARAGALHLSARQRGSI